MAGTEGGQLQIFAYGVFPVGVVDLDQHGPGTVRNFLLISTIYICDEYIDILKCATKGSSYIEVLLCVRY